MTTRQITTNITGMIGVNPRIVFVTTTEAQATVLTAGWLNQFLPLGYTFNLSDIFAITCANNISDFFTINTFTNNIYTLGFQNVTVALPTIANYIAVFNSTNGTLASGTAAGAINPGDIEAGINGTSGRFVSYPPTAANGFMRVFASNMGTNVILSITNGTIGQNTTLTIPDPGQSTGSIQVTKVAADPGANLISFDVTVGQAALAAGGSVTIYPSSGSKQYKIRSLQLNGFGTNFSGGGGNRLGQVTDGTNVFTLIPAATMQALANSRWGDTALPFPASVALDTSTVAGASLVFKYSGGTADYTAGSLVITGILERVA